MARKLRIEEEGACYHVINRGNYRRWIFEEEGAKAAFEKALFESCTWAGWVLHAYCVMGNHYHLAIETPRGNVSEGMRWLQSTFANRFNRFREERGHLFQGRFKSLLVENTQRLGWLCHYIHLNPVRAEICKVEQLKSYRWSSYWYMREKKKRPAFLRTSAWLEGAGNLTDNQPGWNLYEQYLDWLSANEPARKEMAFQRMSKGWAIGSKEYLKDLVDDEKELRVRIKLTQSEAKEARHLIWEDQLQKALHALGKTEKDLPNTLKSSPWKVAIAALLKQRNSCANGWLGEYLHMGTPFGVSRYISEMQAGSRSAALKCFKTLTSRIMY